MHVPFEFSCSLSTYLCAYRWCGINISPCVMLLAVNLAILFVGFQKPEDPMVCIKPQYWIVMKILMIIPPSSVKNPASPREICIRQTETTYFYPNRLLNRKLNTLCAIFRILLKGWKSAGLVISVAIVFRPKMAKTLTWSTKNYEKPHNNDKNYKGLKAWLILEALFQFC